MTASKHKIKCKRCGECCKVISNGLWVSCPYQVHYEDGHTMCMIYRHRLGAIVGEPIKGKYQICEKREDMHYNIIGCPYNKPDYPFIHKVNKPDKT